MRRRLHSNKPRTSSTRRGTLFHYYMMYLFLSSVMLTAAGLCIHSVLKADRLDSEVSTYLKTLLHLEQSIRNDAATTTFSDVQATTLTLRTIDDEQIQWTADGNIVRREVRAGDTLNASERFVFQKGTELSFNSENAFVRVLIIEPAKLTQTVNGQAVPSTARQSVEMILPISKEASGGES